MARRLGGPTGLRAGWARWARWAESARWALSWGSRHSLLNQALSRLSNSLTEKVYHICIFEFVCVLHVYNTHTHTHSNGKQVPKPCINKPSVLLRIPRLSVTEFSSLSSLYNLELQSWPWLLCSLRSRPRIKKLSLRKGRERSCKQGRESNETVFKLRGCRRWFVWGGEGWGMGRGEWGSLWETVATGYLNPGRSL